MVTPEMILARLPAYVDRWELIKQEQFVPDIITEVSKAHHLFAGYYDKFSDLFYDTDPEIVADNLFYFCQDFLKYQEETKEQQTSGLPTAILYRGYITGEGVDCKHYALFNAGVIGSLNRMYNCCFDAKYFFVGYGKAKEPYHVFVNVRNGGEQIWLDPTPGSGGTPTLIIPKPL